MEESEVGWRRRGATEEGEDGKVLWRRQGAATQWRRARSCGMTKVGEERRHGVAQRKRSGGVQQQKRERTAW
jgi:hypothetical protein